MQFCYNDKNLQRLKITMNSDDQKHLIEELRAEFLKGTGPNLEDLNEDYFKDVLQQSLLRSHPIHSEHASS